MKFFKHIDAITYGKLWMRCVFIWYTLIPVLMAVTCLWLVMDNIKYRERYEAIKNVTQQCVAVLETLTTHAPEGDIE